MPVTPPYLDGRICGKDYLYRGAHYLCDFSLIPVKTQTWSSPAIKDEENLFVDITYMCRRGHVVCVTHKLTNEDKNVADSNRQSEPTSGDTTSGTNSNQASA